MSRLTSVMKLRKLFMFVFVALIVFCTVGSVYADWGVSPGGTWPKIRPKEIETLHYPYSELFRDFSASLCRPNSVLVTYGYGFGDDHINRIIQDMLTIPSTHLVIISFDDRLNRIQRFCSIVGRNAQISLLIGNHFGNVSMLVEHYLPKPAIDQITWREAELLKKRGILPAPESSPPPEEAK